MRRTLLAVALILAIAAPLHAQQRPPVAPGQDTPIAASDDPTATASASSAVPLDEIRHFVTVYDSIRQAYVEPRTDAQLMHAAVRGLLFDLDPHSVYFDREDAADFDADAEGQYDGLGVQVQQQPGPALKIIAPMDGSPAARAGLRAGDLITGIDGKPIDTDNGSKPLRGKAGTAVKLTVRRGNAKPFDVTLVREKIVVPSVQSKLLEPGLGYVRASGFQANTAVEFEHAIAALSKAGPLRGLLVDLRSNPGGLLNAAVQMADDLLDTGVIVSTRGRLKGGDTVYRATPGDLLKGAPVVVLVDAGSASASEVLAGALQDSGRARIVGSRTFGKGSVQSLLPLDNGDAVKLTTARYYTPKDRSIQGVGILPDVSVHADGRGGVTEYREAALPGHLRGDGEMAGETGGEVLPGDQPVATALAELKRMAGITVPGPTPKPAPRPAGARPSR